MIKQPLEVTIPQNEDNSIIIGSGKVARQADGSATLQYKNCTILATVCATKSVAEGQSFFPLSVDYSEKFSSAGRIPGSFHKREGRLSDYEILISRLIDRAFRPLFPDDYLCSVQVMISLISSDPEVLPDSLACLAASAAFAVTDIPLKELISEVRIGRVDGQFIINPSRTELENSDIDFIVAGTSKNILMVEGEADECSEEDMVKALQDAHEAIKKQIEQLEQLRIQKGISELREYPSDKDIPELEDKVVQYSKPIIEKIISEQENKSERTEAFTKLLEDTILKCCTNPDDDKEVGLAKKYLDKIKRDTFRNVLLDKKIRIDGRTTKEVRQIDIETSMLPTPHGSALFTRGETQALCTATLGSSHDELMLETASRTDFSKFILHYNFPGFSTGEVRPNRGPGRREVGHGNLAHRSINKILKQCAEPIPYTIRIISDILESNGSSSMATVCGGSLSLMDAGIKIPKHIAGIAMGMVAEGDKYCILTDILGDEDHLGDMDFKVTGTKDGICGVQMDIKVDGLKPEILKEALLQAKEARMHILDKMYDTIAAPREEMKPNAPRFESVEIEKEFIGAVIGTSGKVIQELQKKWESVIEVKENDSKGIVNIFAKNNECLEGVLGEIKMITAVPTVGETYKSVVKSIMPYGAFVEFLPNKTGLLHISEVSWKRLENLDGILKEGDEVQIKIIGVDSKNGKYRLSRKVLLPKLDGEK